MNIANVPRFDKRYSALKALIKEKNIPSVKYMFALYMILPHPNSIYRFLNDNKIKYVDHSDDTYLLVIIYLEQFKADRPASDNKEEWDEYLKLDAD